MFGLTDWQTAILGIFFITFMTTLGSAFVFFVKGQLNERMNRIFLGFAAGVMIAASMWSLLLPSIEEAEKMGIIPWLPATIGFIAGGLFLLLVDRLLPHLHLHDDKPEGIKTQLDRTTMLVFAVALHNAPEGLAVGLAFGFALKTGDPALLASAFGLAIGIGIQNLPEGAAVSIPLVGVNTPKGKAFLLGSLSGIVEPIFAALGILLASQLVGIMPWFLSFAAGAMIYVVVEELIPEAQLNCHSHTGTLAVMFGFVVMMILDVAFG